MRDFDFVSFEHDVLVGLGALAGDICSQLPNTVVAGFAATQTVSPSLSINIAAGRIYQLAPSDSIAVGSIPQDLSVIVQQGSNPGQVIALTAPSAGQSQWNLIQAQFSQIDAVRTNDPNGGIVPFYNVANPSQPTSNSINTVRTAVCVLQVITGSAATTGSEVPPTPTNGWVPMYLIDLAGGQTQITTSQVIKAGPSVGTGVPSNYASAPFLTGLLASHHGGVAGQGPKILLGSEVQGILPYANMSPVRTLLSGSLTLYVNNTTGNDTNTGLTPSIPFKTLHAAVASVYQNYDFNGFGCTISVANGTYAVSTGPATFAVGFTGTPVGMNAPINLIGNTASPGSVTIAATNGNGVVANLGAQVIMSGFTVTASGSSQGLSAFSGYGVQSQYGSFLSMSNCVLGSCGSAQLQASLGAALVVTSGVSFTGSSPLAIAALLGGTMWLSSATLTLTGLTVSQAVVYATQSGSVNIPGVTWIGTPTGQRYLATLNGTIFTNTSGPNLTYIPGTVAGSTATGGQYA